jgi:serine/threonine protein kinase
MRQRVAVKVLATVMAENPESVKRFQREARAAFGLVHPNVVRAHDLGMDDKLHFLVMDYVDGTCLHDLLKKYGRMDVLRAAHYVAQAAQGLQYAHEAGLIHRDIKPANLILDRGGTVKILDMGIARFAEAETEVLTRGPLGTADYLAPEQARDSHNVDARADIYSLGATFYTMLTGKLPFAEAKTVAQKLISVQMRDPTPIRTIRPDVPEGISHVIAKMMAKDPAQRYQTLKDVVRDLEPWTSQPIPPPPENEMPSLSPALLPASPTTLPPARSGIPSEKKTQASPPPPSSRPKLLAGAAVAAAVAIGIWIWWTFLRTAQ